MGRGTSSKDSYRVTSRYYDAAYAAKTDLVDLSFYLDLAKEHGGPVLEIGCGTGRVLLPIARAGIEIHGLDASASMLRVLKERVASEPPAVRKKVRMHAGDMRHFRLARKFPLVLMPFRPLQHMHTVSDQTAALRTAAHHLSTRGILAFDVFYPDYQKIFTGIGDEIQELVWTLPDASGKIIRRSFRKESVDKIRQTIHFTFLYRTYDGETLVREESERFLLTYFTYPQLRALFLLAGLEPVAEYGSFQKTPLDNSSPEMIFLLRKSK
jgi:SAM-dependent methyltransferase